MAFLASHSFHVFIKLIHATGIDKSQLLKITKIIKKNNAFFFHHVSIKPIAELQILKKRGEMSFYIYHRDTTTKSGLVCKQKYNDYFNNNLLVTTLKRFLYFK